MKQVTQQRGRKKYKMEGHNSWQIKNTLKGADHKGNEKKSSIWTHKRMHSLDESSIILTTHLKIKVLYICYNATDEAPPSSLMDSTSNPKVKIVEREGVRCAP